MDRPLGNSKQQRSTNNDQDEERRQAEYLAAFTDALLDDKVYGGEEEPDPMLAQTVQLLEQTLRAEPPPPRLRYRLRHEIRTRWPADQESWWQTFRRFLTGSRQKRAWSTAGVLVMIALAVTLAFSHVDLEMTGTASGEPDAMLWALGGGVLVVVVIAVLWWRSSSR